MGFNKALITAGDIFAVPLSTRKKIFGYVRAYHCPDVAILPLISEDRILTAPEIQKLTSQQDIFALRNSMENGNWPWVAHIPFPDEESKWAPPRRQVSIIRPDIKMVLAKGHFIPAKTYGKFEELPILLKLNDEALIKRIIVLSSEFQVIKSAHQDKTYK